MSTGESHIGVNTNLQRQDLNNLDIGNLTPLSPEVISRQATINIGTIGHVAHGKSTVVKAISGVQTVRFKNELERNITIKLERISYERILKISKSPQLLREYEDREEEKIKKLQSLRKFCHKVSTSYDLNYFYNKNIRQYSNSMERSSSSSSSGYESLNDNGSSYSINLRRSKLRLIEKKDQTKNSSNAQEQTEEGKLKRSRRSSQGVQRIQPNESIKRRASSCIDQEIDRSVDKRLKFSDSTVVEYVVENIKSMESVRGQPLFFVKWLNYPEEENTWESLSNLAECKILDKFIEKMYSFFKTTISVITEEMNADLKKESLKFDITQFDIRKLDTYEPLLLKCDLVLLAQFRNAGSRCLNEPALIRKRVIEALLLKPYYHMRKKQLQELSDWQKYMNTVEKDAPVSVENNVDFEVPDKSFEYVKESFPGKGVNISENPPIGCKCDDTGCIPSSKCCARMAGGYFAYEKNGRLRLRPGDAIYECNNTCKCNKDCVNRVIQRGRNNMLCLFKTANGCGWGVRTERHMRKGEYVCEYVGEIITTEEANIRGKQYDAIGRTYLFDLDYNTTAESVYTIDAAVYGNISHFINHSCDPNLVVFPFWINNLDVNMPRLGFFTLRPIKAGEELTFDYIRINVDANDYNNLSEAEKVTCRCGADNCRKVLF